MKPDAMKPKPKPLLGKAMPPTEKQARYQAKPARTNKDRNEQILFDKKAPYKQLPSIAVCLTNKEDLNMRNDFSLHTSLD